MGLVLLIFTRSILEPLTELGRAADRIGNGQYDAPPLAVCGSDELGRTARSFNLMQTEIRRTIHALEKQSEMEKHLLEKEVEAAQMQRTLQEGRFAQLQSQINPHFLFNTLSTIAALAREEGAPLSEDLILRLSSFFRYSLESDEKMVPLGREIQLLQDYMELQETVTASALPWRFAPIRSWSRWPCQNLFCSPWWRIPFFTACGPALRGAYPGVGPAGPAGGHHHRDGQWLWV